MNSLRSSDLMYEQILSYRYYRLRHLRKELMHLEWSSHANSSRLSTLPWRIITSMEPIPLNPTILLLDITLNWLLCQSTQLTQVCLWKTQALQKCGRNQTLLWHRTQRVRSHRHAWRTFRHPAGSQILIGYHRHTQKTYFTTTYHPQTNGQVEIFNRVILSALRA